MKRKMFFLCDISSRDENDRVMRAKMFDAQPRVLLKSQKKVHDFVKSFQQVVISFCTGDKSVDGAIGSKR